MQTSNAQKGRKLPTITLEHIWVMVVLAGIFIFVNTHPIRPHDFWWHMAAGREIVRTGQIPAADTFSYTMAGAPYPSYQVYWLMEVTLYLAYSLGGPALIVFTQSVLVTSSYALLLLTAYRLSGSARIATLTTLIAAAPGLNDWNVRPQSIAFPAAALFLFTIATYRARPHRARLAIFPVGMVIWSNSHGTFAVGLFLIGAWLADESWQLLVARLRTRAWDAPDRLGVPAIALATSALACLLNPQGLGIVRYVTGITGTAAIQRLVTEWAPPTFETLGGQLFYGTLLLSVTVLILSRERPTLYQLITFLAMTALGLTTQRGGVWFGLIAAPTLAVHLPDLGRQLHALTGGWRGSGTSESHLLNTAIAALLALAAIFTLPWFKTYLPLPALKASLISQETPVEATQFLLDEGLPGPLFHEMGFGSYLIWAAQPTYPVFIDPRIELYPLDLWLDYIRISAAQCDWEQALAQYGIQTLMLNPTTQRHLVEAARNSPEWTELYAGEAAAILTR